MFITPICFYNRISLGGKKNFLLSFCNFILFFVFVFSFILIILEGIVLPRRRNRFILNWIGTGFFHFIFYFFRQERDDFLRAPLYYSCGSQLFQKGNGKEKEYEKNPLWSPLSVLFLIFRDDAFSYRNSKERKICPPKPKDFLLLDESFHHAVANKIQYSNLDGRPFPRTAFYLVIYLIKKICTY